MKWKKDYAICLPKFQRRKKKNESALHQTSEDYLGALKASEYITKYPLKTPHIIQRKTVRHQRASCLRLTMLAIPGKARGCAVFRIASNLHLTVDCLFVSPPHSAFFASVFTESHPKTILSNIHTQSRERERESAQKLQLLADFIYLLSCKQLTKDFSISHNFVDQFIII